MAIRASQFEGFFVRRSCLVSPPWVRLSAQDHLDVSQLEVLGDPFLAKCEKPFEIAEARDLVYRSHQALHSFHLALRCFLQEPPHKSLQRFKKQHWQEQQNCRRRFGRKIGFQQEAGATHQTQIKQSHKNQKNRIDEVSLPANLQKVELLNVLG